MIILPKSAFLNECISRLQAKQSEVEIVWYSDGWRKSISEGTLRSVSILDSSFNPPTRAHLALSLLRKESSPETSRAEPPVTGLDADPIAYLLLLSVRNADKIPKPGDASPAQRLQMTVLLSEELRTRLLSSGRSSYPAVAVAAIDEPTFAGKAEKLQSYFAHPSWPSSPPSSPSWIQVSPTLTFIVGFDTLVRIFAPKYYGSTEQMHRTLHSFFHTHRSSILSARRASDPSHSLQSVIEEETKFLETEDVKAYAQQSLVQTAEIDAEEGALSSTLVRGLIAAEHRSQAESSERSWKGMLVLWVAEYVQRQGLYTTS